MRYIDTHAHIDSKEFENDFDDVLERSTLNNIEYIVNVGYNIETSNHSVKLANRYNNIYASIGIHPYDSMVLETDTYLETLSKLYKNNNKIVAIGEIGLDYHYDCLNIDKQIYHFNKQLELAENLGLPVIIHTRDAELDTIKILDQYNLEKVVIHCFTGTKDFAEKCLGRGFYLSFTGVITFKNGSSIREIVKEVPLNKIMAETDSPYLSPQIYRGKRNEPSYVKEIVLEISNTKNDDIQNISDVIYKNSIDFFSLPKN